MSIEPEMLMAYADGELDAVSAKRVEKAMAADPAIAAQVERHRALRTRLRAHFDPIKDAPVPGPLAALIRDSAKVVDLAAVRAAKRPAAPVRWWRSAGAVAAALVVGVVLGQVARPGVDSDFATRGGRLVAGGNVGKALDGQLAETQTASAPVRMLVSFRNGAGAYCRAFQTSVEDGIACREGGQWQVQQLRSATRTAKGDYRQAGSESSSLMVDAQAMMVGDPLDAAGERAAVAKGWGGR